MVVEMSGEDVEVICGEWEIGDASMTSSGERYNVLFIVEVKLMKQQFSFSYFDTYLMLKL